MDSWIGRKRPWEDDDSDAFHPKRRGSLEIAAVSLPPHPPQTATFPRDSQRLDQRRLPPLQTSCCDSSAQSGTSSSEQTCPADTTVPPLIGHRPRSSSLFNVLQDQGRTSTQSAGGTLTSHTRTSELGTYPPSIRTDVHRPQLGSDLPVLARDPVNCCQPSCEGQSCTAVRNLIHRVVAEVLLLDSKVRVLTKADHRSLDLSPVGSIDSVDALRHALGIAQWSSLSLQEHLDRQPTHRSEQSRETGESPRMRKDKARLEEREEQSPATAGRQYPNPPHEYFAPPSMAADDIRRQTYGAELASMGNSPPQTTSSPGSIFMSSHSPMQAPYPTRTSILPSPSSLNFHTGPNLPSISSPAQTSAQSAHLQDLQHQISVKTLAFQTLQREYDSLLQKLERQRTKCATLEKKFEVSDVEINSLTDEKEKLQAQVAGLETQVESLQESRNDARKQLVANGAQYMRIMEMANRLQGQGAEDKKKWEAEKIKLEHRISLLEQAMVVGPAHAHPNTEVQAATGSSQRAVSVSARILHSPESSQTETIILLRAEVGRLRTRTQTLETALQNMRRESISIQTAARQLVETGGRLDSIMQDAVEPGS